MNPQPSAAAPRPGDSQVFGARIQIYARHNPGGYALRGASLAAVATVILAVTAASPSLVDPTNIPGWTLVGVLCATLIGALLVGLPMFLHARHLPQIEETDPFRYASAKLQAASGELGPDPTTNDLARQMSDRLVYNSNPAYSMGGLCLLLVFVAILPLADIVGPGFDARNLFQLAPIAMFLTAFVIAYLYAKARYTRFKTFRENYDAANA